MLLYIYVVGVERSRRTAQEGDLVTLESGFICLLINEHLACIGEWDKVLSRNPRRSQETSGCVRSKRSHRSGQVMSLFRRRSGEATVVY